MFFKDEYVDIVKEVCMDENDNLMFYMKKVLKIKKNLEKVKVKFI